ncbi:hypothetical protein ALC60_11455 [Trachymyrmex zeteki]|uniref:Uncharacterized protein n=1 Tax=Mycetomoellerius zeteki TaxID=64791 RepID=A0A151WNF2_9HYME|nr:hypothetical protein ALC60_11455 [Trachymyrmex zeteki]
MAPNEISSIDNVNASCPECNIVATLTPSPYLSRSDCNNMKQRWCSERTVEHCSMKFESLDGTWLQVNRPLRDFDQHAVRTIRPARS